MTVKYGDERRRGWRGAGLAGAALASVFGASASALAGPADLAPHIPRGDIIGLGPAHPGERAAGHRRCSARAPICVVGGKTGDVQRRWLRALEEAHADLVHGLRLPAPAGYGDDGRVEVVLWEGAGPGGRLGLAGARTPGPLEVSVVPTLDTAWDRADGFCSVRAADPHLARTSTLCLGELTALVIDGAMAGAVRRAYGEHLWLLRGRPANPDRELLGEAQLIPARSLIGGHGASRGAAAGALLLGFLEARGNALPGAISTSFLSLAGQAPSPGRAHWVNEPDLFDVLPPSYGGMSDGWPLVVSDLALARAFLGDRACGRQDLELRWLGAFGRPRFDWRVPWEGLPKRVALETPVEPYGATFLWLDLPGDRPEGGLAFEMHWELPVTFEWQLAAVNASGTTTLVRQSPRPRGQSVQILLAQVPRGHGLILAGTQLGGADGDHPFDPDVRPFEPHQATVYVTRTD